MLSFALRAPGGRGAPLSRFPAALRIDRHMTTLDPNSTLAASRSTFASASRIPPAPIQVGAWPTEKPLFVLVLLVSLGLWALLAISIIGLAYVALIGLFLFFVHLAFVTHLRGSAVRLGPAQFPELHARVQELARTAGLPREPEAYLLESGGSLNALATKFFRGRMIVLFSDLLDACGSDTAARDMVIGHEIGHLRAGHLDHLLLTGPGRLMPFLGAAYSRACERTCDRWGAALCGDPAGAVRGLAILAAGGSHAKGMNLQAFVAQRRDLDTGWMTLGSWLSAYPPLSERVELLAPALGAGLPANAQGPQRAAGILALLIVVPALGFAAVGAVWVMAISKFAGAGSGLARPGELARPRRRLRRSPIRWRSTPPACRSPPTSKRSPPCCASTTPPPADSPSTSRRSAHSGPAIAASSPSPPIRSPVEATTGC